MTVYLVRKKDYVSAIGEYNPSTKGLIVRKGSKVSASIAYSEKFRGAKSIEKKREGVICNCITTEDISFTSPSTAANFVTGNSTNGMTAWKDESGRTLKVIVAEVGQ